MTTESSSTEYSINISIGNVNDSGGSLNFYETDGYTDEMVAAIYEALANLTWPLAVRPGGNIAVSKNGQSNTGYATDYSASPVTFS